MDPQYVASTANPGPFAPTMVAFDAPGVLFDDSMWNRWLYRLLQHIGLKADYEMFFHAWEEHYQASAAEKNIDYWDALRSYLREAGLRPGCIDEVIIAGRSKKASLQQPNCPLHGVRQAVMELYGCGMKLAAIGDAQLDPVTRLLANWRLDSYFSLVIERAGDTPLSAVHQDLIGEGTSPAQVLLVSNRSTVLTSGAKAGMLTVSLRRTRHAARLADDIRGIRRLVSPGARRRAA